MRTFSQLAGLTALALLGACADDSVEADPTSASAAAVATDIDTTANAAMSQVQGFNYLTDCDSLTVDALRVPSPDGLGSAVYLRGDCLTNKSYEVVLVPRAGSPAAEAPEDAHAAWDAQAAEGFTGNIAYAFVIPKIVREDARTGASTTETILPANITVYRLDNDRWNRMGVDRADDEAGLDALRWNVLHDEPMKYQ